MKVYLNEITGMADGIVTLYLSKRTWTPELVEEIRSDWFNFNYGTLDKDAYKTAKERTMKHIESFLKYAWKHTAMLDFVTISATVEGIHRGGQDDWDAHACRFNNRIIRASTRLADFSEGEMSDFYKGKIIPTDVVLNEVFNMNLPDEIEKGDKKYVKAVKIEIGRASCRERV